MRLRETQKALQLPFYFFFLSFFRSHHFFWTGWQKFFHGGTTVLLSMTCVTKIEHVFFFFSLSTGFWMDCLKLFSKCLIINYQGSVRPRSDLLLGHIKKSFHKKCSSSCYSQCVWHMRQLKHGIQHSQHPKTHKKQPETWNKLASQWMAEDSRVKTDRNQVDK